MDRLRPSGRWGVDEGTATIVRLAEEVGAHPSTGPVGHRLRTSSGCFGRHLALVEWEIEEFAAAEVCVTDDLDALASLGRRIDEDESQIGAEPG